MMNNKLTSAEKRCIDNGIRLVMDFERDALRAYPDLLAQKLRRIDELRAKVRVRF